MYTHKHCVVYVITVQYVCGELYSACAVWVLCSMRVLYLYCVWVDLSSVLHKNTLMKYCFIIKKILYEVSLTKLCIDQLMKTLWPEAHRNLILYFPLKQQFISHCLGQLYRTQLFWIMYLHFLHINRWCGEYLTFTPLCSCLPLISGFIYVGFCFVCNANNATVNLVRNVWETASVE